ncbi:MAG: hypothetical protein ACYCS1_03670 [Gammaproteobacteria bacterium]
MNGSLALACHTFRSKMEVLPIFSDRADPVSRYRFRIFHFSSNPDTPRSAFGQWIRVGLVLGFFTLVFFLFFAIGWFFLLLLVVVSIPLLIRNWYMSWRLRHSPGPEEIDSRNRLLEGEWRPIEEHPIKDDEPLP